MGATDYAPKNGINNSDGEKNGANGRSVDWHYYRVLSFAAQKQLEGSLSHKCKELIELQQKTLRELDEVIERLSQKE